MTTSEHWRLAAAALSHFPSGLTEKELAAILVETYGFTPEDAKAAIAEAIKRGWIVEVDGVLLPQEPHLEPDSPLPSDDGPGL